MPNTVRRVKFTIKPIIAEVKFFRAHVAGLEDNMRRVVKFPILMQNPVFGYHAAIKRSAGIGSQNVECSAFDPVCVGPLRQSREAVPAVLIETKDIIKFDRVPIVSPNGDVLVKEITFEILPEAVLEE